MSARVTPGGGSANVATGIPVLDHLLGLQARSGRVDLELELPPGAAEAEGTAAGRAHGERDLIPARVTGNVRHLDPCSTQRATAAHIG